MFAAFRSSLSVDGILVSKIQLKTCQGWCLGQFPVVKEFLEQDFENYDSKMITVDYNGGSPPRLVLMDDKNNSLKTLDISKLSRIQIRKVLESLKIPLATPLKSLDDIDDSKVKFDNVICLDKRLQK